MKAARGLGVVVLLTVATVAATSAGPASAYEKSGTVLLAGSATGVAGSYVVVFRDAAVGKADVMPRAQALVGRYGGAIGQTYQHALRGFEARLTEDAAKQLAGDPAVRYVQQNQFVSAARTQLPTASWGLDRLDQRTMMLNHTYTAPNHGAGSVRAYVIDSGIAFWHNDFGLRAVSGRDVVDNDNQAYDCSGHGTHVAGTIGGSTFGVAKSVTLVGVRVVDCADDSRSASSLLIAGIDWVVGDHDAGELAVANISLGGMREQAVNDAVNAAVADGITVVVSADNNNIDACDRSPASTPAAITVGATRSDDLRSSFSNYGPCLDLFAPGESITSADFHSSTGATSMSGTSMAAPHVTGAAALVLAANPTFTPAQVRDRLVADATNGVVMRAGAGSPNRLLHVATPNETGCSNINADDVRVPDTSVAESAITITGCPGNASSSSTVEVHLRHGYIGDVVMSLIAPDGTSYVLHQLTGGGSRDIHHVYTVVLSRKVANGTWRLRIEDTVMFDDGDLDAWSLNLIAGCTDANPSFTPVFDSAIASSAISLPVCNRYGLATSVVWVSIVHPFISDLVVSLIAPDGSTYLLHNRTGFNNANLTQAYPLNLSSEWVNGTWRLQVWDALSPHTGYLSSWALNT